MSEWKEYCLNQVCHLITDGSHFSPKDEINGFPMFSVKDMRNNGFDYSKVKRISKHDFLLLTKQGCQPEVNDILIAKDGSVLKHVFRVRKQPDYVLLSSIAILRPKKQLVDPSYLEYFLKNPNTQDYILSNFVSGSGVPRIVLKDFKAVEIIVPSISEQTKIADILTSIDNKIGLLYIQNKTLKELAVTLFSQWFIEEADESWELVKISDVAEINSKSVSKNFPFQEIEYLDTGSITNGVIDNFQTVSLKDAPSRAQRIAKNNDIVYSLVRPIHRHFGLLNGIAPNTVVSTGFCVISSMQISPHFLYILLTKDESVDYFDMIAEASTSTYPSLKPSDIANFEFLKPPEEKLKKFSKIASDSWEKINANYKQIQTLTQLRENLLPKLMNGEIKII